jgi:hypothetical protein
LYWYFYGIDKLKPLDTAFMQPHSSPRQKLFANMHVDSHRNEEFGAHVLHRTLVVFASVQQGKTQRRVDSLV